MMEGSLVADRGMAEPRARRRGLLAAAFVMPWYAAKRQTRWVSLLTGLLGCIGGLAVAVYVPMPRGHVIAIVIYASGLAFAWAFWFSGLLLVARDAWHFAAPHGGRTATGSALLWALLCILPPILLEAAFGSHVAMVGLVAALAVAAGLAFVLLPRWLAVWLGFLPGIYGTLHDAWHLASPLQPQFLRWGSLLLVALLVPAAWRWWRLLRADAPAACGWTSPMIFQLRQQAVTASWSFDRQLFWREGKQQHRFANLHGIDARTPAKAVEIALGALFVPQTAMGNLRRLGTAGWPLAVFGIALLLVNLGHMHSVRRTVLAGGIGGAMWGGMFGSTMLLFALHALLRRRWEKGAEPALLALLPGLDRHASLHGSVVRAAFTKPLLGFAALWALMTGCEALAHFGVAAMMVTTTALVAVCLLSAVYMLRLFAARPSRTFVQGLVATCVFSSMLLSLGFVIVESLRGADALAALLMWAILAAWVVFAGAMAILVVRAWRTLRARPHPFLGGVQ